MGFPVVADLTLQEAADTLGVHYMTAYRYVRLGVLPAAKVDGSWRIESADIDAFRRVALEPGQPSEPGAVPSSRRRTAPWAGRFEARLLAGDGPGAWAVIEAALVAGAEPTVIHLDVIAPAMVSIGDRWEAGEIDVAVEHRASAIAIRLIGRLGPRFVRRGRTRGVILIGAPSGDRHSVALSIVADLLRSVGFEVHDLGADVPIESFVRVARELPALRAVGVGVSVGEARAAARELISRLHHEVPGLPVVVGGRGAAELEVGGLGAAEPGAASLGADGCVGDGHFAVATFERVIEACSRS